MTDAPGSPDAGFLAFRLFDALLSTLIAKNILTKGDVAVMLDTLANDLGQETRALSKTGAGFIRQMIAEKGLK